MNYFYFTENKSMIKANKLFFKTEIKFINYYLKKYLSLKEEKMRIRAS